MITKDQQQQGTGHMGFLRGEKVQTVDMDLEAISVGMGQNLDTFFEWDEDFIGYGQTAPMSTDYSPTGTPTFAFVSNGVGGQVLATVAADNAAMFIGAGWSDNLQINALRYWIAEARALFGTDLATAQYALIGASGAIKTGVNLTTLAGFIGAAFQVDSDNELHCIIQNGTDVTVDYPTGIILDDDTWYWFKVEYDQMGAVGFWFGPALGEDGSRVYTQDVTWAADTKLQPLAGIAKTEGTTTPTITVDRMNGRAQRSIV